MQSGAEKQVGPDLVHVVEGIGDEVFGKIFLPRCPWHAQPREMVKGYVPIPFENNDLRLPMGQGVRERFEPGKARVWPLPEIWGDPEATANQDNLFCDWCAFGPILDEPISQEVETGLIHGGKRAKSGHGVGSNSLLIALGHAF